MMNVEFWREKVRLDLYKVPSTMYQEGNPKAVEFSFPQRRVGEGEEGRGGKDEGRS
jgi:hypothetical protein